MSFDGPALSFDDEGSILFDGEKIIVTVPVGHEALDHLGTEKGDTFSDRLYASESSSRSASINTPTAADAADTAWVAIRRAIIEFGL